jgi:hypothetical protein
LAQEVELRLERSLEAEHWLRETLELAFDRQTAALMLAIGCTVQSAAQMSRLLESPRSAPWLSNAFVFEQVTNSVNRLLQFIKPDGDATQLPPGCAEALGGYTNAKVLLESLAGLSAKSVVEEIAGLGIGSELIADGEVLVDVVLGSWRSIIRDWLGDANVAHLRASPL